MHMMRKHRAGRAGLMAVAMVVAVGLSSSPAFGVTMQKKKALSLSSITFLESVTNSKLPFFAAIHNGFFQKYGLTVNWVNSGGQGSALEVSAFLGGGYNFIGVGATSLTAAVAAGGPIRAVGSFGVGSNDQLLIQPSMANQLHIPYIGVPANTITQKQAEQQLKALKGTHLIIGFSNTLSNAYIGLFTAAKNLGLTMDPTSPCSADLCATSVGTTANQTTGFDSGKLTAIAGIPPVTGGATGLVPGNAVIPDRILYPENKVPGDYIVTTPAMVLNHPDTVQALLDGFAYGMGWALTHRSAAEAVWQSVSSSASNGTSDPVANLYQFNVAYPQWTLGPYPYKQGYDLVENGLALTQGTVPYPYPKWVITRFAANALKLNVGYKWA